MKKLSLLFIIAIYFALSFVSCQPVKGVLSPSLLDTPYEIMDSAPLFCAEGSQSFYENRVLFVVDQTKSNKQSDPQGRMRMQSIRTLIEQNDKNNVSYGIITFSNNKIFSPINLSDVSVFTSDSETLETALEEIFPTKDKGRANYEKVLQEVTRSIDYDVRRTRNKIVDYHIVFMSDGSLHAVSEQQQRNFVNGIQELVHTFDRVQIHSIYYGDYKNKPPGFGQRLGQITNAGFRLWVFSSTGFYPFYQSSYSSAQQDPSLASKETEDVLYLRDISEKGQGSYVDQNQDSNWGLNLNQQWDMDSFIVYNLNAGFCLDGHIGLDSDVDGLCDRDEMRIADFGFEPHNRFSFNDGYSDYFHWLAIEKQQMLPKCSDQEDKDHDLLTYCEEQYINSIVSNYPLLKLDNPDSDGDGILDGIEVLVYWATDHLASRNPDNLDQESGGLSDYEKIVKHISPFVPVEDQMTGYDTSLFPVKGQNGTCYSLRQTKLPFYSSISMDEDDTLSQVSKDQTENTILIYTLRQRRNSNSHVYQFMHRDIQRDSNHLSLPVEGDSFQYLAFTHAVEN